MDEKWHEAQELNGRINFMEDYQFCRQNNQWYRKDVICLNTMRDYSQFKGKRILFLGAHAFTLHLIEKAKQMGVYTIVTDYVKNAPAKKYADKAYDVSTLDVEALIQLAKKENVDGVFTGYVDINLAPCRKVCEALGLPFYATLEQLDATMNKVNFKNNCRAYGISVVDDIPLDEIDGKYDRIAYPVIVKPADSYSSKGISVCYRKEEMPKAIEEAFAKSTCKQIVVEKYLEAEDVYLYFTVQNGYLSLSAMADRLLNTEQYGCAPQPVGYFFPSKYIDLYFETVHDKLQKMVTGLGLENGSFFMQGFVMDNEITFFEMGLRLSGGAGYLQIEHQNEINQIEMHLRYALTGRFDGWDLKQYDNPRFSKPACVLVILLRDGKLATIEGLEEVLQHKNVFNIIQFKRQGDILSEHGTLNQVFARIYLCADTTEELMETISFVKRNLKISDDKGSNMILNLFDETAVQ